MKNDVWFYCGSKDTERDNRCGCNLAVFPNMGGSVSDTMEIITEYGDT